MQLLHESKVRDGNDSRFHNFGTMKHSNRVIFYINRSIHLLDMAGAAQAFYEAHQYGQPYQLVFCSDDPNPMSSAGLPFGTLVHFSTVEAGPGDLLIVPGFQLRQSDARPSQRGAAGPTDGRAAELLAWLRKAAASEAVLCSVCTGAFLLAEAGLLDDGECTTHWRYTEQLQRDFPKVKVLTDRLFVKCGNIYTSAGVTTGLDLALFLLEERHGPEFTYKVARELVVYMRRDGSEPQQSVYLQYRSHVNGDIHTIQDWMIQHLQQKIRIEELAALIFTSPRNLTRLFKLTTGVTVGQYLEKLRVEKAVHLLRQQVKVGTITRQCGLQSDNQLRSLLKKHTGRLPSELILS
jgi:transcriptional regulator GlxA family with amidase domain